MGGVQKAIAALCLGHVDCPGGDQGEVGGTGNHHLPDKGEAGAAVPAPAEPASEERGTLKQQCRLVGNVYAEKVKQVCREVFVEGSAGKLTGLARVRLGQGGILLSRELMPVRLLFSCL